MLLRYNFLNRQNRQDPLNAVWVSVFSDIFWPVKLKVNYQLCREFGNEKFSRCTPKGLQVDLSLCKFYCCPLDCCLQVDIPKFSIWSSVLKHESVDEKSTWMLVGITTEQSTIRPWHRTSLEMIYLYILCHQANFRHNFRLSWHQFRHLWAMRSFSIDLETFNKISCVFCSHSHVLSNNGEVLVTCV